MRYVMKEKMWAIGNDFVIKDQNGNDVFMVDGRAFSLGQKHTVWISQKAKMTLPFLLPQL